MQFSLKNTKIQKPIFYHSNIIFNQFWEFFFFRISHLFYNFTPFFRTLFNFFLVTALLLAYTNPLKKKVSPYLSRFSNYACYKFVTSYAQTHGRTHGRTDELLDHNTSSRPKGPRANKRWLMDKPVKFSKKFKINYKIYKVLSNKSLFI